MQNTYWNNTGTYQEEYTRLNKLVPDMGNADTVAGEMLRAVGKLGYELYNNGMGNNSSGCVNFLEAKGCINHATWETIVAYTTGRLYDGNYMGDKYQVAMESLVDQTIEHIIANPALETQPNTQDMFDLAADDMHFCSECEIEMDTFWSHTCDSCTSDMEEEFYEDEEF